MAAMNDENMKLTDIVAGLSGCDGLAEWAMFGLLSKVRDCQSYLLEVFHGAAGQDPQASFTTGLEDVCMLGESPDDEAEGWAIDIVGQLGAAAERSQAALHNLRTMVMMEDLLDLSKRMSKRMAEFPAAVHEALQAKLQANPCSHSACSSATLSPTRTLSKHTSIHEDMHPLSNYSGIGSWKNEKNSDPHIDSAVNRPAEASGARLKRECTAEYFFPRPFATAQVQK
eukprot:UN0297